MSNNGLILSILYGETLFLKGIEVKGDFCTRQGHDDSLQISKVFELFKEMSKEAKQSFSTNFILEHEKFSQNFRSLSDLKMKSQPQAASF